MKSVVKRITCSVCQQFSIYSRLFTLSSVLQMEIYFIIFPYSSIYLGFISVFILILLMFAWL